MNPSIALVILLVFPISAAAASCRTSSVGPCRPDDTTKDGLNKKIVEFLDKKNEVPAARAKWQSAREAGDKAIELSSLEAYLKAGRDRDAAASDMLLQIQNAYRVAPPNHAGTARTRASSGYGWASGMDARWRVRIAAEDMDYRKLTARDGSVHGMATEPAAVGALMYPDGEAVISLETILDAASEKNPGVIAQILYHEGRHFTRLITGGWTYKEKEEIHAYSAVIDRLDAFDLSQSWIDLQTRSLADNIAAEKAGSRTAYSISPDDEKAVVGFIGQREADEIDLAKYYQNLKDEVERSRLDQEEEQRRAIEEMLRRGREAQPAPLNPQKPGDPRSGPAPIVPEQPLRGAVPINGPEGSDQIILLQGLALNACSEWSFVNEDRLAAVDWARVRTLPNVERGLERLTACESRVYTRLMDFAHGWTPGMTITAGEIIAAVPRGPVGVPQGGGGSCRRGDDPFGCQPRR